MSTSFNNEYYKLKSKSMYIDVQIDTDHNFNFTSIGWHEKNC